MNAVRKRRGSCAVTSDWSAACLDWASSAFCLSIAAAVEGSSVSQGIQSHRIYKLAIAQASFGVAVSSALPAANSLTFCIIVVLNALFLLAHWCQVPLIRSRHSMDARSSCFFVLLTLDRGLDPRTGSELSELPVAVDVGLYRYLRQTIWYKQYTAAAPDVSLNYWHISYKSIL